MSASITRIPVAMKRGRKVTKGPMASISVIYEPAGSPEVFTIAGREVRMDFLLTSIRARSIEKAAQQEAWIERSSNVKRWPGRRFRSEKLVDMLRNGGEDVELEIDPDIAQARHQFLEEVRIRCEQILALEER